MTEKQLKSLGELIAKARNKHGVSLRQLAEQIDADSSWIQRVEQGLVKEPSPERLAELIDVLDLNAARMDRVSGGYIKQGLVGSRSYFRAKYDLTPEQTEQIEDEIKKLKQRKL